MRSAWPLWLLLFTLTGILAGVVWLTYHPQHPWLTVATRWPLVGPAAQRLQEVYTPCRMVAVSRQPPSEEPDHPRRLSVARPFPADAAPSRPLPEAPPETFERPAWMVPDGVVGFEWLRGGARLLAAPVADAETVATLDTLASLPVLERDGTWARVRLGSLEGWVHLDADTLSDDPPLGRETVPVTGLPGRPPDEERLERARRLLDDGGSEGRLGPYTLYTDVTDRRLLAHLDRVASRLEDSYRRRYGLEPTGAAAAAVVLFRDEAGYRAFEGGEEALSGLVPQGHAGHGLAALYTGGLGEAAVTSTLIHELTHLLSRRAIGPALPPWLGEGLAEDLANTPVDASGGLLLGELGGTRQRGGERVIFGGGYAALQRLVPGGGRLPVGELIALDQEAFTTRDAQAVTYPESGLWIRYLLAPESGLARGFQSFLAAVAAGDPIDPALLARHLGRSPADLDQSFGTWLDAEYRRYLGSGNLS
ncbi:MAG: hypothetical protein KDD11_01200 [Acidobacteria bacterium]|nr:hypothetical protein [Acidobacteriota bacterium]